MLLSRFVVATRTSAVLIPLFICSGVLILALAGSSFAVSEVLQSSEENLPVNFLNVGKQAGLTITNVWGGVEFQRYIIEVKGCGLGFYDYDHDGWLDIYLTNGLRFGESYTPETAPVSHLLKNNRDGTFTYVTSLAGVGRSGWGTGVAIGDYDNDGWDDLFCTYWGDNILYRNQGDGTFIDVTREVGLHEEDVRWGTGSTFLDYDRDGFLDLFVGNFVDLDISKVRTPDSDDPCHWKGKAVVCGPRGLPPGMNLLYHNNGDGTFTDVSQKAGILEPGPHYTITPVSFDYDNDGWPDIYCAVDSMDSMLFHNNHDGTFSEIGLVAGCAYEETGRAQAGMGLDFADYDFDGWLDIYKTHFERDTNVLYRNAGDGSFEDMTTRAGLGNWSPYVNWGAAFIDYDNDGRPDIFYVTGHTYPPVFKSPRIVLRNLGDGKFLDVSDEMGPGVTEPFNSRGSAYGDYDNDGDIDVVVLNMNDPPSLLQNDGGNQGNWIKIKLIGTKCNRSAIGTRVRVATGDHAQIDEVHSGGSVMSQSDLRLHFGLGKADRADLIEVRWPTTQKVETFANVEANQILTIMEGAGIIGTNRR